MNYCLKSYFESRLPGIGIYYMRKAMSHPHIQIEVFSLPIGETYIWYVSLGTRLKIRDEDSSLQEIEAIASRFRYAGRCLNPIKLCKTCRSADPSYHQGENYDWPHKAFTLYYDSGHCYLEKNTAKFQSIRERFESLHSEGSDDPLQWFDCGCVDRLLGRREKERHDELENVYKEIFRESRQDFRLQYIRNKPLKINPLQIAALPAKLNEYITNQNQH